MTCWQCDDDRVSILLDACKEALAAMNVSMIFEESDLNRIQQKIAIEKCIKAIKVIR
jgi:hypothetical protein